MQTFMQWVAEFRLLGETYFTFDPQQYNSLLDQELEKVVQQTRDPAHRHALERMRGFNWTGYIAAAVRNAGYRDVRERQERTHDIVVKLITGGLFRDYDETRHGEFDLRFKRSVGNAVRNLAELDRNRRRLLPTVPIQQDFEPGGVTADDLPAWSSVPDDHDERLIQDFRNLVRRRLGGLGVAVLQVRLDGGEVKSLVGCKTLGSPGRYVIKRVVGEIKGLAKEYARSLGDPELLRRIERAMASEEKTVAKRRASLRARRQTVGA